MSQPVHLRLVALSTVKRTLCFQLKMTYNQVQNVVLPPSRSGGQERRRDVRSRGKMHGKQRKSQNKRSADSAMRARWTIGWTKSQADNVTEGTPLIECSKNVSNPGLIPEFRPDTHPSVMMATRFDHHHHSMIPEACGSCDLSIGSMINNIRTFQESSIQPTLPNL